MTACTCLYKFYQIKKYFNYIQLYRLNNFFFHISYPRISWIYHVLFKNLNGLFIIFQDFSCLIQNLECFLNVVYSKNVKCFFQRLRWFFQDFSGFFKIFQDISGLIQDLEWLLIVVYSKNVDVFLMILMIFSRFFRDFSRFFMFFFSRF